LPAILAAKLWASAAIAAGAAWAVRLAIGRRHPLAEAIPVLGVYGAVYFAAAFLLRVEECAGAFRRILRRR
jgi:putative peptidoglycan lipid II flippase